VFVNGIRLKCKKAKSLYLYNPCYFGSDMIELTHLLTYYIFKYPESIDSLPQKGEKRGER
jgi:hypothetical protein